VCLGKWEGQDLCAVYFGFREVSLVSGRWIHGVLASPPCPTHFPKLRKSAHVSPITK
jgi:hypothetical protein